MGEDLKSLYAYFVISWVKVSESLGNCKIKAENTTVAKSEYAGDSSIEE